jgi:hypothetical protein
VSQRVEGEALAREPGASEEWFVLAVVEVVVVGPPIRLGKTRLVSRHAGDRNRSSFDRLRHRELCEVGEDSLTFFEGELLCRGGARSYGIL